MGGGTISRVCLGEKSSLQLKGFTHLENGDVTFPTWILRLGSARAHEARKGGSESVFPRSQEDSLHSNDLC